MYVCTIHTCTYEADVKLMYTPYVPESPPLGCFKEFEENGDADGKCL